MSRVVPAWLVLLTELLNRSRQTTASFSFTATRHAANILAIDVSFLVRNPEICVTPSQVKLLQLITWFEMAL